MPRHKTKINFRVRSHVDFFEIYCFVQICLLVRETVADHSLLSFLRFIFLHMTPPYAVVLVNGS